MRPAAWVPSSCLANPDKTIATLQAAGVRVANLMGNDMSEDRGPTPFRTFDVDDLNRMAAACRAAGIEVHLTIWAMPHDEYLDGALAVLPGLIASMGATMLWWDAEGPWHDATGCFDFATAAAKAARVFPRLALSGIGAALAELRELAEVCCVWSPQAYATKESEADPPDVVEYSLGRWREAYGEPEEGWCVGLAGYKQAADAVSTMQPPIDDVLAARIRRVCYWTINSIDDDQDVVDFVAGLANVRNLPPPVLPPPPPPRINGIMPTLNIATMPTGVESRLLRIVQHLLLAWDINPGPDDGLPGPKTEAAVKEFQTICGLHVNGVVTGATWYELLSDE
jgi:hypothetical protein